MRCKNCGSNRLRFVKPGFVRRWNKDNPGRVRRIRYCEACFACFATEERPSLAEEVVDINHMQVMGTESYDTCIMRIRRKMVCGDDCPECVVPTEEVEIDCVGVARKLKEEEAF